jgi:hypothetical protein
MDFAEIREKVIKPKLIEVFGNAMGGGLYIKAVGAAMAASSDSDKLNKMVDTICADPKVTGMWGASGTAKQKQEWLKLLK